MTLQRIEIGTTPSLLEEVALKTLEDFRFPPLSIAAWQTFMSFLKNPFANTYNETGERDKKLLFGGELINNPQISVTGIARPIDNLREHPLFPSLTPPICIYFSPTSDDLRVFSRISRLDPNGLCWMTMRTDNDILIIAVRGSQKEGLKYLAKELRPGVEGIAKNICLVLGLFPDNCHIKVTNPKSKRYK